MTQEFGWLILDSPSQSVARSSKILGDAASVIDFNSALHRNRPIKSANLGLSRAAQALSMTAITFGGLEKHV